MKGWRRWLGEVIDFLFDLVLIFRDEWKIIKIAKNEKILEVWKNYENYDGIPYLAAMAVKEKEATFTVNKEFTEEFKVKPEEMKKKSNETATAVSDVSYESLVKCDINFNDYSKIVDEFFALLEGEVWRWRGGEDG